MAGKSPFLGDQLEGPRRDGANNLGCGCSAARQIQPRVAAVVNAAPGLGECGHAVMLTTGKGFLSYETPPYRNLLLQFRYWSVRKEGGDGRWLRGAFDRQAAR